MERATVEGESSRGRDAGLTGLLTHAAWAVSVATAITIAFVALERSLAGFALPLLHEFPGPYGRGGVLFAVAYAAFAAAAVLTAWRLPSWLDRRAAPGWVVPLAAIGLALVLRLVVAAVADGVLYGETRIIRNQAVSFLDGDCCFGHRPPGYPMALAAAFTLLGIGPTAIEALNLLFAAATAWLVWDIGRVSWSSRTGAVAATLYAVMPSQVLFTLVPLTEPMFALLVAAAVRAALWLDAPRAIGAIACGAALAGAQYVRSTAVVLFLPIAAIGWVGSRHVARGLARVALVGAVMLVLLLPVVAYNLETHHTLSVSTSAYGGWSLYVGSNVSSGGQWNAADAARLAALPGDSWWDRSEAAGRLALDRITGDVGAYLRLLPVKLWTLWGDENYAGAYALATGPPTRTVRVAWLTSQLVYLPLTILAAIGVAADGRARRRATLIIGGILVLMTAVHLVLEVHGRYHSYLVPLLCILAAAGLQACVRGVASARDAFVTARTPTG